MQHSRVLTVLAFVSVATLAVPTYVTSQTTTDKMGQKAKNAAQRLVHEDKVTAIVGDASAGTSK